MIKAFLSIILLSLTLFAKGEALVNVEILKESQINPLTQFIGTVKFENSSNLASQSSGLVKKINFEVGQKVKKGEVLLFIDASLLNTQIKSAKATLNKAQIELENAKKDFNRYKVLLEKKSIAQKAFDDMYLKYELSKQEVLFAKASLNELLIQKDKKQVKAPYDGVIVSKTVNLDEWVNNGSVVAKVVDTRNIEVNFNLPLEYVSALNKSKNYTIDLDNRSLKAKLFAAIPSGDKLTRTFPVRFKAKIEKGFIFDGAQAKVSLPKNAKTQALVINRDAVIKRFNQNVIFVINEKSMANMIPVQIIGFDGNKVGIKAKGLKENMQVVTKGNERVFPNQPVKVLNK